jgi:uncharacterized protein (TIGR00251 family)
VSSLPSWLTADGNDTLVAVIVVPRASRTGVDGEHDGMLRVRLAAPPVEGAANAALLAYMAKLCGLPRQAASLASGERSRRKRVRLSGITPAAVLYGISSP